MNARSSPDGELEFTDILFHEYANYCPAEIEEIFDIIILDCEGKRTGGFIENVQSENAVVDDFEESGEIELVFGMEENLSSHNAPNFERRCPVKAWRSLI